MCTPSSIHARIVTGCSRPVVAHNGIIFVESTHSLIILRMKIKTLTCRVDIGVHARNKYAG
jgi:hypothetical protein